MLSEKIKKQVTQLPLIRHTPRYWVLVARDGDTYANGYQRVTSESWYQWPGEKKIRQRVLAWEEHLVIFRIGERRDIPVREYRSEGIQLMRGHGRPSLVTSVEREE